MKLCSWPTGSPHSAPFEFYTMDLLVCLPILGHSCLPVAAPKETSVKEYLQFFCVS